MLCHGFPELAFSWRHQIKALVGAGRWVVAPEARFEVVWDAGHASTEPGIVDALVRATDQALAV